MKTFCYQIHREQLVSRIPGLFAYISYDTNGKAEIHKATDSIDGCYNKIIENIKLPSGYTFTVNEENVTLNEGETYPYCILMEYYYNCKSSETENNNEFVQFIDKGIGKRYISETDFPRDEYDLVPDYIYIATAKRQYNELYRKKRLCEAYEEGLKNGMEKDQNICCECEEYERMGGDKMIDLLKGYIEEANSIAKEFYSYISDNELKLHFNINLNTTYNDIGLLSEYIDNWEAGVKYNPGDLVFYQENSYVCTKETTGYWDEETETLLFPYKINGNDDNNCFELIKNIAKDNPIPSDADEYETYYGDKFEDKNTEGIDVMGDIVISGNTDSKLKSLRRYKSYTDVNGNELRPDYGYDWLFYYRIGMVTNYSTLNDDLGNISFDEEPVEGEVCKTLYAYGDAIINITIPEDNAKNGKFELKIEYIIGAHLVATCVEIKTDDDGNKIYKFEDFKIDEEDVYHGVKYVDTYNFETDSEIAEDFLIITEDGTNTVVTGVDTAKFNEYVNGETSSDNKKYEFITSKSMQTHDKNINGSIATVASIISEFNVTVKNETDYEYNRIFRTDYYNGITYDPNTNVDVFINRGNAAAIEKHIKLGEIKTLDDMLLYANGSFFRIENTSG